YHLQRIRHLGFVVLLLVAGEGLGDLLLEAIVCAEEAGSQLDVALGEGLAGVGAEEVGGAGIVSDFLRQDGASREVSARLWQMTQPPLGFAQLVEDQRRVGGRALLLADRQAAQEAFPRLLAAIEQQEKRAEVAEGDSAAESIRLGDPQRL